MRVTNSTLGISIEVIVLSLALAQAAAAAGEEHCNLQRYAELPVTMLGTQPLVTAKINGYEAHLLVDSGAPRSILSREAADRFQLKLGDRIPIAGVEGRTEARLTHVKEFSLPGFMEGKVYRNVQFQVYGNSSMSGRERDGLIGQDVIGDADMEFDLANGVVRLFMEKDCASRSLAYWAGNLAVATMSIRRLDSTGHHIVGDATLNGKTIRVMFDSGAARSVLTLQAAARVGIKPDMEGVSAAGLSGGIGETSSEVSTARFDVLDLGGEKIRNARLNVSDIEIWAIADMALGADFFLSHRIFISTAQKKIYFTYNGGPVFDLRGSRAASATPATGGAAVATVGPGNSVAPNGVAELKRRAAASAGRADFASAIADLDEAIKLEPSDADSYYQRGSAKAQSRQGSTALEDFDRAIALQPTHALALTQRATIRFAMRNDADARADLHAAEQASDDPALGLRIAQIYANSRHYDEALLVLDKWIEKNSKDDRLSAALSGRCSVRGMMGKDLDLALADCNAALKRGRTSESLNNRAMLYLRRGEFGKAAGDFQDSLKLQPRNALTLYGLGLAERKQGAQSEAEKNIQAALSIDPNVAEAYRRRNLLQ